jgi:Ca2+-binding EF-hand superfamily protein
MDTDGNRLIDFPEFITLLAREYNKRRIEVDVKNAFSNSELERIQKAYESVIEVTEGKKLVKKSIKTLKSEHLASFVGLFENVQFTKAEISDAINEFEDRETGSIEFTQLLALLARKLDRMESETELREAFQVFDHDGDGLISLTDLRHFMSFNIGQKMDDVDLLEMIKVADSDGDGFLNQRGKF